MNDAIMLCDFCSGSIQHGGTQPELRRLLHAGSRRREWSATGLRASAATI